MGETTASWFITVKGKEAQDERELLEWIQRKGGAVTARELQQGPRRFRGDAQLAEETLGSLAKAGIGEWEPQPLGLQGGRPTRAFRLFTSGNGYETPANPEKKMGSVAVASVDADKINSLLAEAAADDEEVAW